MASSRELPHISACGCKPPHTAGRSGRPKMRHRLLSSSCTQRTPAGLPFGMPGIADEIDGAVQQAPQSGRQLKTLVIRQLFSQGVNAGEILPGSAEIAAFMVQKPFVATNRRPKRLAGLTLAGWALTLRMPGKEAFAQAQHRAANTTTS